MSWHQSPRTRPAASATLVSLAVAAGLVLPPGAVASADSPGSLDDGIVLRLESADPGVIDAVVAAFPVNQPVAMLASRAIYLVKPTDESIAGDPKEVAKLAKDLEKSSLVKYAEANSETMLNDQRYHSWPEGEPSDAGSDPEEWRSQDVAQVLELPEAHSQTTGAGVVAVLDSGVDTSHPALSGHLVAGYDYIGDDDDPDEERQGLDSNRNGIVDESYGHGTFVAGVVSLVAPGADIMPMRVLDSDGSGNVFTLAAAVSDAVDEGADVINLSLGTGVKSDSHLLKDVIKDAQKRGVVVVAAAGNHASKEKQYPAENKDVLAVASSSDDGEQVSAFSNFGDWIEVAAPASHILGPVPGGGYAWWAGTSMAAPQVSGQLALIGSVASDFDEKDLIKSVTKSARKMSDKKVKEGSIDVLASLEVARDD